MAYFPFFMNLTDRLCIVIGNGPVAKRKAERLRLFQGEVHIYEEGEWTYEMLLDAFLVIAATNQRAVNQEISEFCREHRIFVNVADAKEESSFLFPSVIKQGPVTIGISTEGSSPLISSDLRQKIEDDLPDSIGEICDFMQEVRPLIKDLPIASDRRKQIFRAIYDKAKMEQRKLDSKEVMAVISRLVGAEENDNISKE
jgi:siroheme synthase-like protein